MARAKTKAAGTNLPVPQNDAEAEQLVAQLGVRQRDLVTAKAHHDAAVAALETEWAKVKKESEEAQKAITEGLAIWASANRERLTNGGKSKTVHLPTGTVLWREGRYSVKHRGLTNENVVEAIRERISMLETAMAEAKRERRNVEAAEHYAKIQILEGFLRTKVEPNKDAMLAAREVAETVRGVTIPRAAEEFAVEPLASQIREVA